MTWVTINSGAGASFIISLRLKPFMVKTTILRHVSISHGQQCTAKISINSLTKSVSL